MNFQINYQYVILIVVFLIIVLAILKATKKDAHLEMNKLLEFLGGKENIIDTETNLSRFKVTVKDVNKVNKEAIINIANSLDINTIYFLKD